MCECGYGSKFCFICDSIHCFCWTVECVLILLYYSYFSKPTPVSIHSRINSLPSIPTPFNLEKIYEIIFRLLTGWSVWTNAIADIRLKKQSVWSGFSTHLPSRGWRLRKCSSCNLPVGFDSCDQYHNHLQQVTRYVRSHKIKWLDDSLFRCCETVPLCFLEERDEIDKSIS